MLTLEQSDYGVQVLLIPQCLMPWKHLLRWILYAGVELLDHVVQFPCLSILHKEGTIALVPRVVIAVKKTPSFIIRRTFKIKRKVVDAVAAFYHWIG